MLSLIDIHTYYGESYALKGVSMEVKEGSVVALLGRNGMGKTTTIRSIIGFTPARRGTIMFRERNITHLHPYQIARLGIGLVPQGRHIFPSLSVQENLTVGATTRGVQDPWVLERVYELFPILKTRARNRGTALSGGEQQMLAIGRALMTNADLLLLDEPSEGLAPLVVREIGDLILRLKEHGLSILLVEQNVAMATKVADRIYVISNGTIVFEGTTEEFQRNEAVQNQYIGVHVAGKGERDRTITSIQRGPDDSSR